MFAKFPWFGVALIVIGLALLLDRVGILALGWHAVFWGLVIALGLFKIFRGFSVAPAGGRARFWGTELFLLGLYFFLDNTEILEIPGYLVPSFILLAIGLGFVLVFLGNLREWHVLIPAVFSCAFGTLILLAEFEYLSEWDVKMAIRNYWPIALILFGASLLLNRRHVSNAGKLEP